MCKSLSFILVFFVLSYSFNVTAGAPEDSAYLDGGDNKFGLILCHGRGKHPTWLVVDPLRKGVHEKLGYHTLSLQMPADSRDWWAYVDDFPTAYETIKQAIKFLQDEKGVQTIYLMGHSMGSRMASAFMAEHPDANISGLIVAGIYNNGGYPLAGDETLEKVKIPVLDIYGGGGNDKDSDEASFRTHLLSAQYKQLVIPSADHRYKGHEDEFVSAVISWLKSQKQSPLK